METRDLTGKAENVRREVEDQARELEARAEEATRHWRERTGQALRSASHNADQYVHEHTWTSITFAAVLGCVVGFFLGRSRHD